MIIVTGTKRSGTSMWMQILHAAGLPVIGEQFPDRFQRLRRANPAGFWESRLRVGVYHASNPDPQTGIYLHPDDTRLHALKVFVPGLVRTDHAFLYRVIATVRPWREYVRSIKRMQALEDEVLHARAPADLAQRMQKRAEQRAALPPELEWWREMYALVRDMATRRYPAHLVTYAHLLESPRSEISAVLEWLGEGDTDAAIAAVRPELKTQTGAVTTEVLDDDAVAVLDDLYDAIHTDRQLSAALLSRMNTLNARLGDIGDRLP